MAVHAFKILIIGVIFIFTSCMGLKRLPDYTSMNKEILLDPVQTPTQDKSFEIQKNKKSYQIEPVFNYELYGLVVSKHNSDSWRDHVHKAWGDYINTQDICVIWGENVKSNRFHQVEFSSGNWTCYFYTKSNEVYQSFRLDQLSNNHVIPANDTVAKILNQIEIGDQIHLSGNLVNYSIDHSAPRNTSTVRTDTGNGACEIVYVKTAEIIDSHNRVFARLQLVGNILTIAGFLLMIAGFFTARYGI